ncbi:hydrolase [Virgisporangium aliadipatigenens]|uniref:Hydrolase n=1 Tax=Virgisporangium aliadipatigenens TaxID=741659 RepID=A0A8J4DNA8_9ACTN|nr:alpha/beta hydrolase [Virgisporangium aliadipatigenens]GIJ43631.1 hydrolase [Virgisporangium aliadipatigenens]
MYRTAAVDGFRLAYERTGTGPPVVLLHGWPSDRTEYRDVVPLLSTADVIVPDLRGFGASDKHPADPTLHYSADAQARSVIALIEELGPNRPVLGGHDIGSRIAQSVALHRPDLLRALVLTPPLPGIGERILGPTAQQEFWYLPFHQLPVAGELIDGRPDAVRLYLRHFWTHWAGPGFALPDDHLEHLVSVYAEPGAFTASIGWYRAGVGGLGRVAAEREPRPAQRIAVPTTVLWPEHDPLFPPAWSDRLDRFFTDVRIQHVDCGHFLPLERPHDFAAAVIAAAGNLPLPLS